MSFFSSEEIKKSPLFEQLVTTMGRMTPAQRETFISKESSIVWKFPNTSEREYTVWIDQQFRDEVVGPVNTLVLQEYPTWVSEGKFDSIHQDGITDILRGLRNAVKNAFSTAAKIVSVGTSVDAVNESEWEKYVKEASGVNLSIYNPAASKYVQEWADLNHEYLKGLPTEYINRISQIVSAGIADGSTKAAIAKSISDAGKAFRGVTTGDQRRAERIARDQVGKLNSTLSRSRMSQAKVDIYKWSTSADERVRGTPGGKYPNTKYSHYIMDKKYKQVDNSSKISDNGVDWRNVRGREEPRHAGQAINCRCVMIPSFIKLKKLANAEINQNNRR